MQIINKNNSRNKIYFNSVKRFSFICIHTYNINYVFETEGTSRKSSVHVKHFLHSFSRIFIDLEIVYFDICTEKYKFYFHLK